MFGGLLPASENTGSSNRCRRVRGLSMCMQPLGWKLHLAQRGGKAEKHWKAARINGGLKQGLSCGQK